MGKNWDKLQVADVEDSPHKSLDTRQPGDPNYTRTSVPVFDRAKVRHSSAESYGGNAGKDMEAWHRQWLEKAFDALQYGGVLKVFSATRTYQRLAAAMEQVGFILEPGKSLEAWAYGSGFPKSLNVSKTLDKHLGMDDEGEKEPTSDEAKRFAGYGTALKPAWEIFLVGYKPFIRYYVQLELPQDPSYRYEVCCEEDGSAEALARKHLAGIVGEEAAQRAYLGGYDRIGWSLKREFLSLPR